MPAHVPCYWPVVRRAIFWKEGVKAAGAFFPKTCNGTRGLAPAVPLGPYRYYDGMLYLLGMRHVSGNFRLYF